MERSRAPLLPVWRVHTGALLSAARKVASGSRGHATHHQQGKDGNGFVAPRARETEKNGGLRVLATHGMALHATGVVHVVE